MGSSVIECTWAINTTQQMFDNLLWVNAFTKDIFASVMASNTVNGLWLYKPLMTLEAI